VALGELTGRGCCPSHETLASYIGATEKTVQVHLARLRDTGWIDWQRRDGANVYRLLAAKRDEVDPVSFGKNYRSKVGKNYRSASVDSTDKLEPPSNTRSSTNVEDRNETESPKNGREPTPVYAMLAAICEASGLDEEAFAKDADGQQWAAVKHLVTKAAATPDEAQACVRYLKSQTWRTASVTPATVKKELAAWRAAGRPDGDTRRSAWQAADGSTKFVY
jgi:hypothetical protein